MGYDEYRNEVVRLAKKMNPSLNVICIDTIRDSFNKMIPIGIAAKIAKEDTEYWS